MAQITLVSGETLSTGVQSVGLPPGSFVVYDGTTILGHRRMRRLWIGEVASVDVMHINDPHDPAGHP